MVSTNRLTTGGRWLPALLLAILVSWMTDSTEAAVHGDCFQPDYVLEVTEEDIRVDCQTRRSVVINGTFPGPPIHLQEDQTTWIRVYNRIPDQNFTMHWHGLAQRAAPFSDGTPLVSQWPIPPNRFFDYEIRPEVGDAGTYFYHSHIGFQQSTAHGAIIVDDACEELPYHYDDEILLMLGDFYADSDATIEEGLLADPFKWSGEPQSLTLNGHSGTHPPRGSNATDPSCTPLIIDVEPDTDYRLRVVGRTVLSLVKLGIEDHPSLEVIEADGEYTRPAPIDHVQASPGQRFSFRLRTKSAGELEESGRTLFWVRLESRDRPQELEGYALLRYRNKHGDDDKLPSSLPTTPPVTLPEKTTDYLEYALQPLSEAVRSAFPALGEVTRTVKIQVNQALTHGEFVNGTFDGPVVWVQNGEAWQENVQASTSPAHKPYLIAFYDGEDGSYAPNHTRALANGGFDPVSRTFTAVPGEVLDVVWESNSGPSGGFDFHPMHVHGEHVYDLGAGNGTYDAARNERRFPRGFVPARRDTSILHRYTPKGEAHATAGWRAWRIRVTEDNVGVWMMHCHIAQHAVMGMNTVWAFGDREDILEKLGDPPYVKGYLEYGGSAYGDPDEDEPWAEVNEWFGDRGECEV